MVVKRLDAEEAVPEGVDDRRDPEEDAEHDVHRHVDVALGGVDEDRQGLKTESKVRALGTFGKRSYVCMYDH
uniref:Uncharacterized protein n=1 Tax=Steinernema glaseri TaxID=37863 RepID=A0A1I7ZNN9_9BILA